MSRCSAAIVCLVLLVARPTSTHHFTSAIYDANQRVTQTGVLKALDWRNPHVFLFVDIENAAGDVDTWSFEGPEPSFFRDRSFSRSDFEDSVGRTITIDASLARDGSPSALLREVKLANGVVFSACRNRNC